MATDLHYAARFGDLAAVQEQLDWGVPVDADAGGDLDDAGTPLMWAAGSRRAGVDVVRLLLARGADPNAVACNLHRTPLREAAQSGSLAKVMALLDAGADPAYTDHYGYTALTSAALNGGPDGVAVVRALVAAGTPLDVVSQYGESALSVASREGLFDVVRVLLDAGADPAPLEWTPLHRAAALGTAGDLAAELGRGPVDLSALDRWERTAWLTAVHAGDVAGAERLLAAGSDPAAQARGGRTALMLAAGRDHADMVEWLLGAGFDPNEANAGGETALMAAAENGAVRCLRLLLDAGADAGAADEFGRTAANAACTAAALRVLAGAGADLDHVDGTGEWPLKSAAEDGDLDRVAFLLGAGAAVDRTSTGAAALHAAAMRNEVAVVRRLVAAGAGVNVLDVDGYTPLHEARSADVARVLVAAGADVTLAGGIIGETALEHHARHPDILAVLTGAAGSPG